MQLKWLEDLLALAQTRSYTRAAELRHVTHPAFGRRIRALEDWAGAALVVRGPGPVALTPAGESLLARSRELLQGVEQARDALRDAASGRDRTVTLATGRTLARTVVADWLPRLTPLLDANRGELRVCTRTLAETVQMLERGEADLMLAYHHPLLAVSLDTRHFSHAALAQDRLVPVTRCEAGGRAVFDLSAPGVPWLSFAGTLALGRLLQDHLGRLVPAPALRRVVESDSADALLEYVLKGVGVAWLPWSMVASACRSGALAVAGEPRHTVRFEVRLYRPRRGATPLAEALWQAVVPR